MIISSFGYTFGKPLSWGKGGPERWSGSKPYHTPDGQEDQLGFHNFEWSQSIAERISGRSVPAIILDAGFASATTTCHETEKTLKNIKSIHQAISGGQDGEGTGDGIKFNPLMQGCYFSLDKIDALMQQELSVESLFEIFGQPQEGKGKPGISAENQKTIAHYLLLPSHANSVSDAILNKVKPIIKKQRPTIGFSLMEASFAEQVSIYPDPILFTEEKINQLRASGCSVEILPESGMEIATKLQGS
ncbi:MAG: hypothetical protein SVP52_03900 [Chloroflexota bacterium]|nr:hypothetical protein [Chloroflexota bacterium]